MDIETEKDVVQEAIEKTGFGRFNLKITGLGALIYANVIIIILDIGYVIPAAVCDFEMTTIDKGRMAIAPVIGNCFGSIFWEFYSNLKGRRRALITALLIQSNVEILVSFISNYWAFLFLKVISGFAVIGEITPLFLYVGEFQPARHRNKILVGLSFAMMTGLIILPILAWAIIPLEFEYRRQHFFFRSWNLYILVCALPAEILAIWLIFFPETPKYLFDSGQTEKLMKVLTHMYEENTGKPAIKYIRTLTNSGNADLLELVHSCATKSTSGYKNNINNKKLRAMLIDFKLQGKNSMKAPYLKNLILLCICMFCVACYSLLTWLPEIFNQFIHFEILYPNEATNVCSILNSGLNMSKGEIFQSPDCRKIVVNPSVYLTFLWMGLAAIFPNLFYLLLFEKLGYRFFAVILFFAGFGSTVGLFYANSYTQNVILACIFQSAMCTSLSVLFTFNDLLFPASIRVFASTVSVFFCHLGTIFGNVIFAYLVSDYCAILIGSVTAQLLLVAVLSLTLRT